MERREAITKDTIILTTRVTKDLKEAIVTMDTSLKVERKEAATTTKNGEAAAARKEVIKQ